jgi:hypothetical protein
MHGCCGRFFSVDLEKITAFARLEAAGARKSKAEARDENENDNLRFFEIVFKFFFIFMPKRK